MAESQQELNIAFLSSHFLKDRRWDLTRLVWLLVSPDRSSFVTSPSQNCRNHKHCSYFQVSLVTIMSESYCSLDSHFCLRIPNCLSLSNQCLLDMYNTCRCCRQYILLCGSNTSCGSSKVQQRVTRWFEVEITNSWDLWIFCTGDWLPSNPIETSSPASSRVPNEHAAAVCLLHRLQLWCGASYRASVPGTCKGHSPTDTPEQASTSRSQTPRLSGMKSCRCPADVV